MKERIYLRRLSVLDIFPSVVYNPVRMKKGRDQMERKAHRLMMTAGISEMLLAIVGFAAFEWVIYLSFLDYKANLAQSEQPLMMIGFTALMTVFFYFIPFLGILFLLNLLTGIRSACRGAGKKTFVLRQERLWLGVSISISAIGLFFAAITAVAGAYTWPVVLAAVAAAAAVASIAVNVCLFFVQPASAVHTPSDQ